jgi:hypothetical protein
MESSEYENSCRGARFTQESPNNNTMHAKPDLRVFSNVLIFRSGSVIVAVIRFC